MGNGIKLNWLSGTSTVSMGVRKNTKDTSSINGSCFIAMRKKR